ncbi:voltage-gated purine nucleotide uniporter SLC17A9-like [Sycon ciliatum]|uniref:voltage-gated purine nucleotide uniporter SLC17A9-like n=1 Tax=Sycon ciliatum TaxID=27933 RepID=UPI0020A9E0B6|eukprot:scpid75793/ scgid26832/ Solute carrier family 17 member 9
MVSIKYAVRAAVHELIKLMKTFCQPFHRLMYLNNNYKWTADERRVWCGVLFVGCMCLYMSRNSLPQAIVSISDGVGWDKHQSGIVLSSFFWGYLATQVLGGWLSDRYGGQHVLWMSAIVWSLLTGMLPMFVTHSGVPVIFLRIVTGAFQGVHYPAMSSLLTAHVREQERTFYFGVVCAGSHIGTVFSGSIVGLLIFRWGWPSVFHVLGALGFFWAISVHSILGTSKFGRWSAAASAASQPSIEQPLSVLGDVSSVSSIVPWRAMFTTPAILAIFVAHLSGLFFFNILINWLPTYFHETFPGSQSWLYNTLPWLFNAASSIGSGYFCNQWLSTGSNLTAVRKIFVGISLLGPAVGLYILPYCSSSFAAALCCVSFVAMCHGASSAGTIANPSDVAPNCAGSVFGVMNMLGALEGMMAVYIAGHILHTYNDWNAVFYLASVISALGGVTFLCLGSGKKVL